MATIGLVVDSGCDLPKSYIDENKILVLPVSIHLGSHTIVDDRDPKTTQNFYINEASLAHGARSTPFTPEQIADLFLEREVIEFDHALVETVTKSRSKIYENAVKASRAILASYKPIREEAGSEGPFSLRVTDSKTLFAGQGALAAATIMLMKKGHNFARVRQSVDALASRAVGFAVVPDIRYLRKRAKKRGDRSVGWAGALFGDALGIKPILCACQDKTFPIDKVRGFETAVEVLFDRARSCIERRLLLAPVVCISYGGDERLIREFRGYRQLEATAKAHNVDILLSPMGLTAAVNIGPGALSLGMVVDDPTLDQIMAS